MQLPLPVLHAEGAIPRTLSIPEIAGRLSFDEIVRLTRLFAGLGVRKLRLTGGEPLLRTNLADLVGDLTDIPASTTLRSRPMACCWGIMRWICTRMG